MTREQFDDLLTRVLVVLAFGGTVVFFFECGRLP